MCIRDSYYYRVRGHNNRGWGRFSQLEDCEVLLGVVEGRSSVRYGYEVIRSPSAQPSIRFTIPAGELARIRVCDVLGRKVGEASFSQSTLYRLANLPTGIYFIEIEHDQEVNREKVVVVR